MPFTLRIPTFRSDTDRDIWIDAVKADSHLNKRMVLYDNNAVALYSTQYGQNIVFKNAEYSGNPRPDTWEQDACMQESVSHFQFLKEVNTTGAHEAIVLATTPDSWSWQHFLDRVTILWAQASLIIREEDFADIEIVSGSQPGRFVNQLYDILGVKHLHQVGQIEAKRLFFSCRTPLIHPFTIHKVNEYLEIEPHPLSKRKVVLMMARGEESGQRHITNQDEFDAKVAALLESRSQGEVLASFDINAFEKIEDLIKYISENVRMIIAPHGGALYNARFASSQTAILEFMPKGRFAPVFWEQSRLLDQRYHVYFTDSLDSSHNMELGNLDEILSWIGSILDSLESPEPPGVVPHYPWHV